MQKTAAKWLMVAGVMIGLTASGWAEEVDAGKAGIYVELRAVPRRRWKGERSAQL